MWLLESRDKHSTTEALGVHNLKNNFEADPKTAAMHDLETRTLMDMFPNHSAEAVCAALRDSANDVNRAVDVLLQPPQLAVRQGGPASRRRRNVAAQDRAGTAGETLTGWLAVQWARFVGKAPAHATPMHATPLLSAPLLE